MLLQRQGVSQPPESSVRSLANLSRLATDAKSSILAAYDMGAPPALLQKIYDTEAEYQRPIILPPDPKAGPHESIYITASNWTLHLGSKNPNAYPAYLEFFASEINALGCSATFEGYLFSPRAKEAKMLVRLLSGVEHPLIQVGYGAEFGDQILLATGLAQAAMYDAFMEDLFEPLMDDELAPLTSNPDDRTSSLFDLLRKVYDEPLFDVPPEAANETTHKGRVKAILSQPGAADKLKRLCASYPIHPHKSTIHSHIEQCIWVGTLLTFSVKDRIDFFCMHLLTSSLFLRPVVDHLLRGANDEGHPHHPRLNMERGYSFSHPLTSSSGTAAVQSGSGVGVSAFVKAEEERTGERPILTSSPQSTDASEVEEQTPLERQAEFIRAYILSIMLIVLGRAKPKVEPTHLMGQSATPRPPLAKERLFPKTSSPASPLKKLGERAVTEDREYAPWPSLIQEAMYHPDSHVVKAMRALSVAARDYGATPKGEAVGSYCIGHPGLRPATPQHREGHHDLPRRRQSLVYHQAPFASSSAPKGSKMETMLGAAEMDGTIFVRAAGVLLERMGWVTRGQNPGDWDFDVKPPSNSAAPSGQN